MDGVITTILILAAIAIIGSGWHGYRKTTDSTDYMVAGRAAPWWLISGSLLAATVSGATFFGLISSYYREGFYTHWIPLGVAFSWLIICFVIGPRLRRFGGYTIPEYLSRRFNSPLLRPVFSAVTIFWLVFLLGTVVVQGGLLLEVLWDVPYAVSVIVMTLIIAIYTFFGGQKAVMYTDFFQTIIFLAAVVVAVPVTLHVAGGWETITTTISAEQPGFFGPTGGVMNGINAASLFLIWFLGYLGHPGYLTRFYTARSERDVYKTGIAIAAIYLPFWALIGLAGSAMRVLYPDVADTEIVWVLFVLEYAPSIVAGLLLAGILAAILSTADTWLLTAASSLTHDLARAFTTKPMSDIKLLRWTRWSVALLALAAMPVGLWRPTYITEMMNMAYTVAGASGGLVILFSLYWSRMTRAGAWAGLLFGAVTAAAGRIYVLAGTPPDWFDPILPTLIATTAVLIVVSLMTSRDEVTLQVFQRLRTPLELDGKTIMDEEDGSSVVSASPGQAQK